MFNLKQHKAEPNDKTLLERELNHFDIIIEDTGTYRLKVGDENVQAHSLDECLSLIEEGTKELKSHIWQKWDDLNNLADLILNNDGGNHGGINNLLFLSNIKKSYLLSLVFPELEEINQKIQSLLNVDIVNVSDALISKYNYTYLYIKLVHRLIMHEVYRTQLINRFKRVYKVSQISGPWANLDLPMSERVWEWSSGEEEYFDNRKRQRREQVRYNPENATKDGFYYVWQDLSLGPYRFEDMKEESPYKSRLLLTIP